MLKIRRYSPYLGKTVFILNQGPGFPIMAVFHCSGSSWLIHNIHVDMRPQADGDSISFILSFLWSPVSLSQLPLMPVQFTLAIVSVGTGPWFNIKMSSYQLWKSHCGGKMILRPSYLHNGISYTGKTTSLHWIRSLMVNSWRAAVNFRKYEWFIFTFFNLSFLDIGLV